MKKEDINPNDWHRMLFGEAPVEFLAEVFLRTLIIYIALLIIVRLMGKRMSGQLTISELSVMVTLGAIVSPAMQIPQLGILMGMMILICALLFQRGIYFLEYKSQRFEEISQGTVSTLVEDGVIQLDSMSDANISRQQLFSVLRKKNVLNLGEVSRVYLEACGMFSVYKNEQPFAGLPIFPPLDSGINGFSQKVFADKQVCKTCGCVSNENQKYQSCPVCNSIDWISASISVSPSAS